MASAVHLLGLLAERLGWPDLADRSVLDMGCGTKFTKAIVEHGLPVGRYVGVDTSAAVIELLRASVSDERFEFHHVPIRNQLYNPDGAPLAELDALPIDDEEFDAICLFSVFTHLDPPDFVSMLRLLRPYVAEDGRLLFSVFLHEDSGTGFGIRDQAPVPPVPAPFEEALQQRLAAGDREAEARLFAALAERLEAGDPELVEQLAADLDRMATAGPDEAGLVEEWRRRAAEVRANRHLEEPPPDFVDLDPDRPLLYAVYTEDYARRLIDGSGWEVEALHPPDPYIQYHFVCRPA